MTFEAGLGVEAANLDGTTGFSGGQSTAFESDEPIVDYDEVVDRNEELVLLSAYHSMVVWINSTATADGTAMVTGALRTGPTTGGVASHSTGSADNYDDDGPNVVGGFIDDDTIDVVGRPLTAVAHNPFSDGASGVGGGGSAGVDDYESTFWPGEFGRFHPRDELFLVGELTNWNMADAGIHAELKGQHIYGVVEA